MNLLRNCNAFALASLMGLTIAGCTNSEEPAPDPDPIPEPTYSYRTTSNVGDLSTWTLEGNMLSVEWKDIAPVTGAIEKTYIASAVCASQNDEYGYRNCLVDGDAQCVSGTQQCGDDDGPQDGDTLTIFEVPGTALLVNSGHDGQLHAGFAAQGCSEVATQDYSYINIGLGQRDVVGLFRTDGDFSTVHHMDFGFSDAPDNELSYNTNDPGGLVAGLSASPCDGGVRELTIAETNDKLRLVITAAGHLVLDKPEGQGGMLAISKANAAVISDFASKSWHGISFPDEGEPEYISVTTGPLADGRVQLTSIVLSESGDITPMNSYINSGAVAPSLNGGMMEPNEPYFTNQIVSGGHYTNGPSELPGVFELDPVSGDETAILGIGATVNGKTMLFGAVVNGHEENENVVKGNFILFEK